MKHGLVFVLLLAACTPAAPPAAEATVAPVASTPAQAPEASVPSPPPGPYPAVARVTGRVTYPSEELPAMRVCALDSTDPGRALCVFTAPQQADFSLEVPAGDWWLLAWPHDTGTAGDPGLLSAASACLARAETGCDDHALLALTLAPGELREGIEINDWYYDPATFPPPMAPRDETAD
jgi:hypothetical protein